MKNLLFPHRFQRPALVALVLFAILSVCVLQFDWQLSILATPPQAGVFLSDSNLTDEVCFTGFLISLTVYGFSRERDEDEYAINMRFSALVLAVLLHTLISLLIITTAYGLSFPLLAMAHLFTVLILYVLIYKVRRLLVRISAARV
jgi:hypothetical protein